MDILQIVRENVKKLTPYSSARDEYTGAEGVFLDANENPYSTGYNRYPDPYQRKLKKSISQIKDVPVDKIFLGNGSDEAIDLLVRVFCEPRQDAILIMPPTYGMYKVAAEVNDVKVKEVSLVRNKLQYSIDVDKVIASIDEQTKLVFICNPNNPTGNLFDQNDIIKILKAGSSDDKQPFMVIVDEAYIDFAQSPSLYKLLDQYPNLVILQTFSKAWGYAGIRLGMAFAQPEVISMLSKIKLPYNLNQLTQEFALQLLEKSNDKDDYVKQILDGREYLLRELPKCNGLVNTIYPTDSNFILLEVDKPVELYNYLVEKKIIVRNRSNVHLCEGCLRITVGTPDENHHLLNALNHYKPFLSH